MPEPTLVYILAASHSGSTLLAMLLNSHPEIATAGELKATSLGDADRYRCSCREFIRECGFWQRVSTAMSQRGIDYDVTDARTSLGDFPSAYVSRLLKPLHRSPAQELARDALLQLSPTWRAQLPPWAERNRALVESISEVAGVRFVADSSKIAIRLKYLSRIQGLGVKVVRLVRDGRAVALTYMNPSDFADASDPGMRGGGSGQERHHRLTMAEAALEWRRSNEEAEEVLKTVPADDQVVISYEDLCTRTGPTLHAIHSALGLEASDLYRSFRDAEHHVVGNGMRLDDSSEIRLDDRWRTHLARDDLAEFEQIAGRLNRRLGYE